MMTVYESEIPGVGRKFELELAGDDRLIVLVHHDGRREVFHRPTPDADSTKLFDLDAATARRLASLLQGTTFETVDVASLEVPLGGAIIEWTEIPAAAPYAGETLSDLELRRTTGVTVIAIQRGEETTPNPDAEFRLQAGDVLVTLGTREEHAALDDYLDFD